MGTYVQANRRVSQPLHMYHPPGTLFCQSSITEHKVVFGGADLPTAASQSPPPHTLGSPTSKFPALALPAAFPCPPSLGISPCFWETFSAPSTLLLVTFFFLFSVFLTLLPFRRSWHLLSLTFTVKSAGAHVCFRVPLAQHTVICTLSRSSILTLPNPTAWSSRLVPFHLSPFPPSSSKITSPSPSTLPSLLLPRAAGHLHASALQRAARKPERIRRPLQTPHPHR